jgi:hypothetical protein
MYECICVYVGMNVFTYEYSPQTFLDVIKFFVFIFFPRYL